MRIILVSDYGDELDGFDVYIATDGWISIPQHEEIEKQLRTKLAQAIDEGYR
jgi:hypothetical protein